jgi:DNA-binding NtrC family response regulator
MSKGPERSLKILVVDDEVIVRDSLKNWLREDGHAVESAADARQALTMLRESSWDMALLDIKMPGMDGLELQRRIREIDKDIAVIIMTAYASVETAVRALKEGAQDYITKPFDPEHLAHIVRKTSEQRALVQENLQLRKQLADVAQPSPILGQSASMRRVVELVETVAPTETTVLITGESGTGKELVARAIHAGSPRAYMPLVVVNCGALPEGTLESELFGHERGAFTGAQYRHKGKFEVADGGTLFLDEIGEISAKIQVELLRVLEEKKVTRLGGTRPVRADFRTVAATNRDLMDEMQAGRFREDLYYRLNVFHIKLPPLRERGEDVPELARAFADRHARSMNRPCPTFTPEAMGVLKAYSWPGNVRELNNAIERSMVLQTGREIDVENLPYGVRESRGDAPASSSARSLVEAEKAHVERILTEVGWNISEAARVLEVDRSTVYHKIKQFGLKRD